MEAPMRSTIVSAPRRRTRGDARSRCAMTAPAPPRTNTAAMRIHHLNCISTCPVGGHLMDGRTPGVLTRGHLCCHCLLLETNEGLVLVDTGLGLGDCASPRTRLSAFFLALLKPEFREEMTAARQVEQLGFRRSDVRHIVMTHLDFDHAGGLDDFPDASIHMLEAERDDALLRTTWLDRQRFRPQQWGATNRSGGRTGRRAASAGSASKRCGTSPGCRPRS